MAQDNKTPILHGPLYFLKIWKEQIKSFFTLGKAGQQMSIKPAVDDKKTEICAQVVTWAINKPAASWIEYGPTAAYGSKTSLSHFSPNYNHNAVDFSGLERNATYHFQIIAEDDKSNKIVSDDYTFTTEL